MEAMLDPIISAIAKATDMPCLTRDITKAPAKKHGVVVGASKLDLISLFFDSFALDTTVVIPRRPDLCPVLSSNLDELDEVCAAMEFEEMHGDACADLMLLGDLQPFKTDAADFIFICTPYAIIQDEILRQGARVLKDGGKVIVFSSVVPAPSFLEKYGYYDVISFPSESFFIATLNRSLSRNALN
jgi:SAM-dependent methyltransferase